MQEPVLMHFVTCIITAWSTVLLERPRGWCCLCLKDTKLYALGMHGRSRVGRVRDG